MNPGPDLLFAGSYMPLEKEQTLLFYLAVIISPTTQHVWWDLQKNLAVVQRKGYWSIFVLSLYYNSFIVV